MKYHGNRLKANLPMMLKKKKPQCLQNSKYKIWTRPAHGTPLFSTGRGPWFIAGSRLNFSNPAEPPFFQFSGLLAVVVDSDSTETDYYNNPFYRLRCRGHYDSDGWLPAEAIHFDADYAEVDNPSPALLFQTCWYRSMIVMMGKSGQTRGRGWL